MHEIFKSDSDDVCDENMSFVSADERDMNESVHELRQMKLTQLKQNQVRT